MGSLSSAQTPKFQRTMCFIDGGYLRENMKRKHGDDRIDFHLLQQALPRHTAEGLIHPQLIRVYYYDAIPEDQNDQKYKEQIEYINPIKLLNFYEVKLGRLIKDGKGAWRQKGVDVLLAIDMLKKAYEDHYEWAILLAGDDDYVDLVKAVKDTGKRVYGFYFDEHISQRLKESFDSKHSLLDISRSFRPSV